jgi:hypothetical protein
MGTHCLEVISSTRTYLVLCVVPVEPVPLVSVPPAILSHFSAHEPAAAAAPAPTAAAL